MHSHIRRKWRYRLKSQYSTKGAETVTARHISRRKSGMSIKEMDWKRSYRSKTVGFAAMLIVLLWYAIVTTVFAAMRSGIFLGDFAAFVEALWNGIRQSCKWIVDVAKALAQVGNRIPNETIAIIYSALVAIYYCNCRSCGCCRGTDSDCGKENYEGISGELL